jgi:hypothetical protein
MSPPSKVSSILEFVDISPYNRKDAEALLKSFVTLKDEKKNTRSETIQKLFPLVFRENASVETTPDFEELKKSPWYWRQCEKGLFKLIN